MKQGTVSVIMGIYNCAATLPDAIESIVAQTYPDWQLVMCDDGSTDNTYEIAQRYVNKYPDRMILIRNEKNMRLGYSLNRCLQYTEGEYIARMDGDDRCTEDRFEKQIQYLRSHPEVRLVGTAMQRFDAVGLHDVVRSVEKPCRMTLKNAIPFHHATIVTYKSMYDTVGGYTVADRTARCEDYDLWFKFFYHNFEGANLPEALYYVREDENAIQRRTVKCRIDGFRTTCWGFSLLGFPKVWLIKRFAILCVKACVPVFAVRWYRAFQASHQ